MEKTVYVTKTVKTLEATHVVPQTLTAEVMPYVRGEGEQRVEGSMFGVHGTDKEGRKAWCATFADIEESQSWIYASKAFGRPVLGLLIATSNAEEANGETREEGRIAGAEQSGKSS